MALSNSQYDQIMRTYELRQLDNEHKLRERYDHAYARVPKLKQLDDTISSLSVSHGKKLLEGDNSALEQLKEQLTKKKSFLSLRDCPQTTWRFTILVRIAGTPVISELINATACKRLLWIYYIRSLICRKFLHWRIFPPSAQITIPAIILTRSPAGLRGNLCRQR